MKIPKITFITNGNENIGSTRLRVYRIAEALRDFGYDVGINQNIDNADILVFQKSGFSALLPLFIKARREKNKFLVFDIDDYADDTYRFFVAYADLVVTPSCYLRDKYLKVNRNIAIVDNVLDIRQPDCRLAQFDLRRLNKVWFGNRSNLQALHDTGLKDVTTITSDGDIEWNAETIDRDLQQFDLLVLPQVKDSNGLAKSNCRMLKALYLGIPVLAQNMPFYVDLARRLNYPESMIVTDIDSWTEKCEDLRSGKLPFHYDFQAARRLILQYYGIENIVDLWLRAVCAQKEDCKMQRLIKRWKMEICLLRTAIQRWVFTKRRLNSGRIRIKFFGISFKF